MLTSRGRGAQQKGCANDAGDAIRGKALEQMRDAIEHEPIVEDLALSAMWLAFTGLGVAVIVSSLPGSDLQEPGR